jgi:cytochrome b6-f complex iron-sulfur subunit
VEEQMTSRRDFLYATAAVAACAGCSLVGSRSADVETESVSGEVKLTLAQSSELLKAEGSVLVGVKGTGRKILVISSRDGRLHAISAVCTHMGCAVTYDKKAGRVVCPCHGSQFTVDGANLKGPASRPLDSYDVRNDNGSVVITGA